MCPVRITNGRGKVAVFHTVNKKPVWPHAPSFLTKNVIPRSRYTAVARSFSAAPAAGMPVIYDGDDKQPGRPVPGKTMPRSKHGENTRVHKPSGSIHDIHELDITRNNNNNKGERVTKVRCATRGTRKKGDLVTHGIAREDCLNISAARCAIIFKSRPDEK